MFLLKVSSKSELLDNILALYKIRNVHSIDNDDVDRNYAFNDKMLSNEIFIEYYTRDNGDDNEITEHKTELSVLMKHKNRYYQFLMFTNTIEVGTPVMLLQTIIFLVNLIEANHSDKLVQYLTQLSIAPLIPHEIADCEYRDLANELLRLEIEAIHTSIQQSGAALN